MTLQVGDIDLDEAVNLMFRPRTASLFGRIPFGTEVVAALHELLADLCCSPPDALERTHLESQILLFYNAVEGYVENVQSNYSIDPRWALTARVARTVSRLQLKEF